MDKRSGTIVITLLSVALAACSVAPAANLPPAPIPPATRHVPAATVEDYQSSYQGFLSRASGAAAAAVTTGESGEDFQSLHRSYESRTTAPAEDIQSLYQGFLSRASGAAAAAVTTDGPAEDFQSLHATHLHLPR